MVTPVAVQQRGGRTYGVAPGGEETVPAFVRQTESGSGAQSCVQPATVTPRVARS